MAGKVLNFFSIPSYRYAIFFQYRNFHYNSQSVVIAAAARTPWGKYKGQLASASAGHLGQTAVEAAVKQSAIPLEQIKRIFMNETPELQKDNGNGEEPELQSFIKALQFLKSQKQIAAVVGGLASATQNEYKNKLLEMKKSPIDIFSEQLSQVIKHYISESLIRYEKSQSEGIFHSELVPLTVQQQEGNRRSMKEITQDEILYDKCRGGKSSMQYCDGAAALVLTTVENAEDLKLSPQAILIDFEYLQNTSDLLSSSRNCVENLFSKVKLDPQQIHQWEIEDYFPQLVAFLKNHLNLSFDLINPHGSSLILGYSPAVSLTRILAHMTHSLKPMEYGCVICSSYQESLALIIQKLTWPSIPDRLPLVTLYTKDLCPLCDILVEELELNFSGEYTLEKVFIDKKDNLRFLRLYRFDIPVVFLNNQFLCMHRLNHRLLRMRLDLIKRWHARKFEVIVYCSL